jgi:hypothetical protein
VLGAITSLVMENHIIGILLLKTMLTIIRLSFLFLLSFLFSCRQENKSPDIEGTLINLTKKFDQLPNARAKQTNFYTLKRSVTIGTNGTELQLRSSPDTMEDPQSVILVINSRKQVYAIPFFSNTYRDYWNFRFDNVVKSMKPVNTSFQKELQTCIDTLELNDSLGTATQVINEMLVSLLQCRRVYDSDSTELLAVNLHSNDSLPEEDSDSCHVRSDKIWQAIFKEMHPNTAHLVRNSFWDERNYRVYQFDYNKKKSEKLRVGLRVYRPECIWRMMYL